MKLLKLLILAILISFTSCDRQEGSGWRNYATRFWIPERKNCMFYHYVIDNPNAIESNDQFKDTVVTWITNDTIHFERIYRH